MLIFIYGKDSYRSRQKLNEIVEHYKKGHKSGLNLRYLDGGKLSFQEFKDEIRTSSMFEEKKLIILVDVFVNSQFKEEFLKAKETFKEIKNIILFYETSSFRKNDPLFNFLKKHGKSQEFSILKDKKLEDWVKEEFKRYKAQIDVQALRVLIDSIGGDLYRFSNEIRKLVAFKKSPFPVKDSAFTKASAPVKTSAFGQTKSADGSVDKQKIEIKDVEFLVKPKIETDIFRTIDAIASGNKKQALVLFHKHLQKGDSPFYLFSMIAFQFRNLLIVKDLIEKGCDFSAVSRKSKLHPYVARKAYQYAKNFTIEELKRIYRKLFEIDIKIKRGQILPEAALDLLVAEI